MLLPIVIFPELRKENGRLDGFMFSKSRPKIQTNWYYIEPTLKISIVRC